jgi:hypothetical protein
MCLTVGIRVKGNGRSSELNDKILLFTPAWTRREFEPFYEPCREARANIRGITTVKEDRTVASGEGLGDAYQRAQDYAVRNRFDYLMILEDDEAVDEMAALDFLSVAKATDNTIYGAPKRLRKCEAWTPWRWIFEHPQANGGHPINDRIMRLDQVHYNPNLPYLKIRGGIITSPMFYRVEWFEEHGLGFDGPHTDLDGVSRGAGMQSGWDTRLSDQLDAQSLHFWACPAIQVKHYDLETRKIWM